MRDYATVSPTFWTGRTGRAIKAKGSDAIIAALYLVTCPSSSMTGLYYLPVPTLAHETGLPLEGASKALRSLREVGFADYDEANEVVLVREMARYQIGESITATDNRSKGAIRDAKRCSHSPLFAAWFARYRTAFNLPESEAPKAVEASPSEAPPKPLRSQDQEQDHEQEQEELSPAPKAPTTGTPLELTPPKVRAPRKAAKPPADPPPFDPLAAYEAIASAAGGRFAVGQKSEWDGGHVIRARVLIRKFPDLATWSLVGAWLASGVMNFRGTLSVGWVAKSFAESVTLARDWDAKGRPAGGANRAPDLYAPKPAPVARVVTPSTVNADLDAYMAGMEKKR